MSIQAASHFKEKKIHFLIVVSFGGLIEYETGSDSET